jgi:hypothetical protein
MLAYEIEVSGPPTATFHPPLHQDCGSQYLGDGYFGLEEKLTEPNCRSLHLAENIPEFNASQLSFLFVSNGAISLDARGLYPVWPTVFRPHCDVLLQQRTKHTNSRKRTKWSLQILQYLMP